MYPGITFAARRRTDDRLLVRAARWSGQTQHQGQLPDRVIIMAVLEDPNTGSMAAVDASKRALRASPSPFELSGYFAFGAQFGRLPVSPPMARYFR